ncbi:hypothetical protein [Enterobacillus tribolii]|uniref:Parallel beta helix pectate lyase-like protein n=1 Tax=Enterobacillus tribolii TaxID=1487935 RepID=A0A370R1F7_9GAMM|nr:hypothetical protein [Enterobacillus tribolii]MBW7982699.1 hypothetical protein [Enterobacillus tribolii]RDK95739.1 hypothetical protein C8D90_102220 [Enterobacillus tribolii]
MIDKYTASFLRLITPCHSTVKSVEELRDCVGSETGIRISTYSYYGKGESQGYSYSWDADSTDSDDEGLTIKPTLIEGPGRWKLLHGETLHADMYGVVENDILTAYSTKFTNLFKASSNFSALLFGKGDIYFNNAMPAQFSSGTHYKGGTVIFTDKTKHAFSTTNKKNFSLTNFSIKCTDEDMDGGMGGGYVYLSHCDNFFLDRCDIGPTPWDGIKLFECHNFSIKNSKGCYNKSTAIQLEGCYDYCLESLDLSSNGRYSYSDEIAPVPVGFSSQVGRGVTAYSSVNSINRHGKFLNINARRNTEFGLRIYCATGIKGSFDIEFNNCTLGDNGAPAGKYGENIFPAKGADILINSGDTNTRQIYISNSTFYRTYEFGNALSIHATDTIASDNSFTLFDDAQHKAGAILFYGGNRLILKDNISQGASTHLVLGSALPNEISLSNERALSCLSFITGFSSGNNTASDCYASHPTEFPATAGSNGINCGNNNWVIKNSFFSGFYYAIAYSSGSSLIVNNITQNSINSGFRNFGNSSTSLVLSGNVFDSANPIDKGFTLWSTNSPNAPGLSSQPLMPSTGFYANGHIVIASNPLRQPKVLGWRRLTSGTTHNPEVDWQEIGLSE